MELTHSFTVPTGRDATWAHFQDIGGLAECFPGAQVTGVGEDADGHPTFEGTCKVKLGPIALVYAGAGAFVERDEAAGRFVVEAKGRDKRGNGTAGATVTVTMADDDGSTRVEVLTDLAITGKPAQFGRGVMQDVSDKLLGQFVACLEQRLADDGPGAAPDPGAEPPPLTPATTVPDAAPAVGAGATDGAPSGSPSESPSEAQPVGDGGKPVADPAPAPTPVPAAPRPATPPQSGDDALDLGSTVLPILARTYGKKVAAGLGVVAVLLLVRKVLRRG